MLARSSLRSILTRRGLSAALPSSGRSFSRSRPRLGEAYRPSVSGGKSDLLWIIGSLAVTIPAAFVLMNSGAPPQAKHKEVKHSDPHEDVADTASTSPGAANENAKLEPDESLKGYTQQAVEEAKETVSKVAENPTEKAAEIAEKVKETTMSAAEKVKGGTVGVVEQVKENVKDRADEEGESSKPQKYDPADTAMKEPGDEGTQSGKQEGLSNADTFHSALHDERGQAIKKKPEGTHDTAKLKGTVDVNRPAK